MKITTYVELTPAQERAIEDFQNVVVRTALSAPFVTATFTTFQSQELKVTLSATGVIEHITWGDIQ